MTDIYDIKDIVIGLPFSPLYTILVSIFFLGFLFLIFKKNKRKNTFITEIQIDKKIDFNNIIDNLSFEELSSVVFLKEVSLIFRTFLEEELGYKYFSKLTLEEIIKLNIKKEYLNILENIYYKEYKEVDLTNSEKKTIYNKIKKIIKEKNEH